MRIPTATYRLQFDPGFGFDRAREILDYLQGLGVSDIYASPVFQAREGSGHGYDVVDHNAVNPELGGEERLAELLDAVRGRGMGWLQDFVPNHMAFHYDNRLLMDVLENGERSGAFGYFDIDWDHSYPTMNGRLLAPFLGRFYGRALEEGDIRLEYGPEGLRLAYFDLRFPLRIDTYTDVLTHGLHNLRHELGAEHPDFVKLLGIFYVLQTLSGVQDPEHRRGEIRFVKRMLWELYTRGGTVMRWLDNVLDTFNNRGEQAAGYGPLDRLASRQYFRLSYWKVATEELNYRRFFNINDLICLNMGNPEVFDHVHSLVFSLLDRGRITGLRLDHVDGLFDPADYMGKLRRRQQSAYILVEKILDRGEDLPRDWPVQGTTGYDFLNQVNGLFCLGSSVSRFDSLYARFTGFSGSYPDLVAEKKRIVIKKEMSGEVENLCRLLHHVLTSYTYGRDITFNSLKRALEELLVWFPVYRTYASERGSSEQDLACLRQAFALAVEKAPDLLYELEFLRDYFLYFAAPPDEEERRIRTSALMRFQQFTGPLMAKGFEDTFLYVYNRLLSLNEVGGAPGGFGVPLQEFHEFCRHRAEHWPSAMSATATHDTKRGEDVRARLNVLSEIPQRWERRLRAWSSMSSRRRRTVRGRKAPDRNDEYMLYQTLVGAFPFREEEYGEFRDRLKACMLKSVREAKVSSDWVNRNPEYEDAFLDYIDKLLPDSFDSPFLQDFLPFQREVARYGMINSLAQTLIKAAAPGVPDFYQGSELWDLSLVDPDNRRPVDFGLRERYLRELADVPESREPDFVRGLLQSPEDGRVKLYLTQRVLRARAARPALFGGGDYIPLQARGPGSENVAAFARRSGGSWAVAAAPRFPVSLLPEGGFPLGPETWGETVIELPEGAPRAWRNVLGPSRLTASTELPASEVFGLFPAALLLSED